MKTLVWIGSSCVVAMVAFVAGFLWIPHGAPTASTKVVNDSAESLTLISVEYHTCGNTGSVRTNGLESGQSRRFVYHVCGEGGYTVYGTLMPAADSLAIGGLPLGLAHHVRLLRPVASGQPLTWRDVAVDETNVAVRFRRQMEAEWRPSAGAVRGAMERESVLANGAVRPHSD